MVGPDQSTSMFLPALRPTLLTTFLSTVNCLYCLQKRSTGHGRLALRGALLAVLAVQESERDADLRELGVDRVPIREQAGVHLPGAHSLRFLPGDVVLRAAAIALSDRVDDLSLSTSLAGILFAMIRSFLSTTGTASRAYRRRTGGARARAVLKRAAGGTEGQYSRFWIAVQKRATGGTEKDDYSIDLAVRPFWPPPVTLR